jgi:hypothetical protein
MSRPRTRLAAIVVALLFGIGVFARAGAARALTTIDNPGGGQVIYGPLTGVSSLPNAMVTVLRTVHSHFGDRPQIGKFFQARDSNSVATFFTLTAKAQGGGPIAGLVIVSMQRGADPAAAVLFDQAPRFAKTEPAMMKALNEAWHVASARPARNASSAPEPSAAPVRPGRAQGLRMVTAGDRSATIGLPPGWRLAGGGGGEIEAEGPNGEMVMLGAMFQGLRVSWRGDLFSIFTNVSNQNRRRKGLAPGAYKLVSSQNLPGSPGEPRVVEVMFEVDFNDGRGPRKGSARLSTFLTPGLPTWSMTVNTSNLPKRVADAEAATMTAIIRSFSVNSKVVDGENRQVADRINRNAEAAQIRANAQSAANDASNSAFDAHMKDIDSGSRAFNGHMDDVDRQSKSFENYQLDRTVIQDNDYNERGTVGNGFGDALVKANPDRFQYVRSQDFIKGVDY